MIARVGATASEASWTMRAYAASFEMSATRFIVAATPRRSASRLARTSGSSAMTITPSKKRSTAGLAAASALERCRVNRPLRAVFVDDRRQVLERLPQVVLGAVR